MVDTELEHPTGSGGWLRALAAAALTALVYFSVARYVVAIHDPVSLGAGFWPGAGVTVTALLLCRTRWWPVILVAVGLAEFTNDLWSGYGVAASVGWSVANMVEPLLAAGLVLRFRASALNSVRDVGFFVVAACVAAPIVGGAIGAVATLVHGSTHGYAYIVVRWAIGDGLGILTIAPAGLLLLGSPISRRSLLNLEAAVVMLAVTVSAVVVFFFSPWSEAGAYLVVPALLLAAIRFRLIGAAVSIFIVAQIADAATGLGYGAFTLLQPADVDVILALQVYLATMAITMLVVGARTHESLDHQRLAAAEEQRADLEDALARLAHSALESTDHEVLRQSAIPVLQTVVGRVRAHELFDDVGTDPSGDRFSDSARAVLHSARRRLDTEAELVTALRELGESTAALVERETKLAEQAALLDETRDAIVVRDLDNRVTYWNRGAEQIYGWSADEAMQWPTCKRLFADAAEFATAAASVLDVGEWSGELGHLTESGVELTMDCRWTLMRDQSGHPSAVLTISSDVTERRRLEQRVLRTQRMESIGTLAGGLAHDLNNVLAPIMMSTDLLASLESDPDRMELIRTIEMSAERAGAMVRQILTFARGVEGRRINVDVDELLRDVERLTNDMFLKTIRIVRKDSGPSWPVVGDPTQLHQVLLNLCVNARDAMPDGGILRLAADNIVDDVDRSDTSAAKPGPYVRITVEDDGIGMAPTTIERVFEPFSPPRNRAEEPDSGSRPRPASCPATVGSSTSTASPGEALASSCISPQPLVRRLSCPHRPTPGTSPREQASSSS